MSVEIVSLLSETQACAVCSIVRRIDGLIRVNTSERLLDILTRRQIGGALINLMEISSSRLASLADLLAKREIPVTWWTPLCDLSALRLLEVATVLPCSVVWEDRSSRSLEVTLRTLSRGPRASGLLLHRIAPALRRMPFKTKRFAVSAFGSWQCGSTEECTTRVIPYRRTLERACRRAGLRGPHRISAGVAVAHSWEFLQPESYSLEQVASKCGYRSARTLTRHYAEMTGFTPREAVRSLSIDAFVTAIERALRQPTSHASCRKAVEAPMPSTRAQSSQTITGRAEGCVSR